MNIQKYYDDKLDDEIENEAYHPEKKKVLEQNKEAKTKAPF